VLASLGGRTRPILGLRAAHPHAPRLIRAALWQFVEEPIHSGFEDHHMAGGVDVVPGQVEDTLEEHAREEGANKAPVAAPSPHGIIAAAGTNTSDHLSTVELALTFNGQALKLRLALLPEHSDSSVAFMKEAAVAGCDGELYRSEHNFLIQGRISCGSKAKTKVVKGACPPGTAVDKQRACPSHDPQCGCHGPIMTRGMVGWAGGSAGPDFFVYTARGAATHWAHDHTVFAQVADDESWTTIEELGKLPVRHDGMTFFKDKIRLAVGTGTA
jgi:hypothetical protein